MDWKLFALTFTTLFLAEMGDKTQLAVFTLVAQHRLVIPVFLGASLALSSVSLIGALFGGVVSKFLPPEYLQIAAGILFIGMGAFILVQAIAKLVG
ncbi:MAG: Ca2+/H+ antiporter, family [Bacillota bacterium]|nr:TMEM165/GDT1 family protein [Bacillota bacterium]MDK2930453.1 Ca2+/H+ antiporter, family [Bacillota bacterium]